MAPVRGWELTTRRQLLSEEPDHPRADEEYFQIQIGELLPLAEPILAGDWKRFTFLYTTGEYFRRARILRDLTVRSSERKTLWTRLCERALKTQEYRVPDCGDLQIPEEKLLELLGLVVDPGVHPDDTLSSW
jgi:hypothetical protein